MELTSLSDELKKEIKASSMHPETQIIKALKHLRSGESLTSWEAIGRWRCTRLADVIFKLREAGHNIKTEMKKNAKGNGQYAVYTLIQKK